MFHSMFRLIKTKVNARCMGSARSVATTPRRTQTSSVQLPDRADVVIIGGGSAGCNALYHLGKSGIKAVLLDKSKLISGTTWHTAGLVWGIRGPYDVEMQLLNATKRVLKSLEDETGIDPGWINNGGLLVVHTVERLEECKRLVSGSKVLDLGARIISPKEAKDLFPLLDERSFRAAVYSPTDGVVDPSMLINALTKSARNNGCQVIEDCPVTKILTDDIGRNKKKVCGVETPYGILKSDVVLNAAGIWSKNVANSLNVDIPLVPFKHAYVVTEPMAEVEQRLPNVRDSDYSMYFRIQGNSIALGGYESNPILIGSPPDNFSFSLYELDWDVFNVHMDATTRLMPKFSTTGIRTTVCGPESFTPDHKPLMGEDPRCSGLFYSCGYNSAGMMWGGGCGEQISRWIINGRPDYYMFDYDIRRFIPEQRKNLTWMTERSYEAYARNYNIVFPHDQPLSGRNLKTDPFHDLLVEEGAIMEERQGWERPGWFHPNKKVQIVPYNYEKPSETSGTEKNEYREILEKEYSFEFSSFDDVIRNEALACRNDAALFDMSYLGKFYLCGPEARKAADYLFTADTRCETNKTIYTCMLNKAGGVEMDCTVTIMEPGSSGIVDPIFKDIAFYVVASGAAAYHTWAHMNKVIEEKGFDTSLHDVTEQIGILSIQGPNSRSIVESLIEEEISDESFGFSTTRLCKIGNHLARLIRISFVGELGFEIHIPRSSCQSIYMSLMEYRKKYNMKLAGFRALYSLSCEKGYHLWGSDIRSDDNPVEAGLGFVCRDHGCFQGKSSVDLLRRKGIKRKLLHFHVDSCIPLWGLEPIYRNDVLVGYLRRAERGYSCKNTIGRGYIKHPNGENISEEFLKNGNYEIEVMGKRCKADVYLRSPFDPRNKRIRGIYENVLCP